MTTTNQAPKSFKIIAIVALLWNLIGVLFYLLSAYMPDEVLKALPQAQQDFIANTPAWVTAAFAIGVFGGTIASLGLLLRKKWCVPLFIISLLAILAQNTYGFVLSNGLEVYGTSGLITPILVIIIAIVLVYYSRKAKTNGWLS